MTHGWLSIVPAWARAVLREILLSRCVPPGCPWRRRLTAHRVPRTPGAVAVIEEIVVTAQRREENLQKTSVPVDVLSGDELRNANVLRVTDLSAAVPGLQVGQGAGPTQIYIRGVGDFGSTPINNPAVAANIDGVYVARSQALEGNFFDVARVEVLKGPQGTLYGRNASGGAINIITNRPSFDAVSGYGDVEVGNYSMREFQGALNLPVSHRSRRSPSGPSRRPKRLRLADRR